MSETKPKYDLPSIEDMLKAGVHFGHQVRRWHPKMEKYIYATDNKSHIIDVYQTQELLKKAAEFLYNTAKEGKQIVIVGTKRQASNIIELKAQDSGALFVTQRWLGGTFTNYESVEQNWKEMNKLIKQRDTGELQHYTKKERLLIDRKIDKLKLNVGGINGMKKYPGAMVIVDVKREKTALNEANKVKVPVVGIVDTNSDPNQVQYVIPANDDAIKSIDMLLETLNSAIKAGYREYAAAAKRPVEEQSKPSPKSIDLKPAERKPQPGKTVVEKPKELQKPKSDEKKSVGKTKPKVNPKAKVKK